MEEFSQKIEYINVKDLVLWTENPRDPISSEADNQDIVNRALSARKEKWALATLAKEMGAHFDFSELPTVVYKDGKPIVYDGNRRVILAKIVLNQVDSPIALPQLPVFPEKIPCNVCAESIAIDNIYRKHANTGSWDPIARDIFLTKFKHEEKTPFLVIDELTHGAISSDKTLNQRFVRDELLTSTSLEKLGISVKAGLLQSVHTYDEIMYILKDLFAKIKNGTITTRINRGMVEEVLEPENQNIIRTNKQNKEYKPVVKPKIEQEQVAVPAKKSSRVTRTVKNPTLALFGKKLSLEKGEVNNLYRDISAIYECYDANKKKFSENFWALIRMSLRLICETASHDKNFSRIDEYIKEYFPKAKKTLNQNEKTALSSYSINEKKLTELLHTGAHNYLASKAEEQTRALSMIIGAMLNLSHGKE